MTTVKDLSRILRTENVVFFVQRVLDKYVKRDEVTKMSVFFTGISAYLTEPINLFLKGESGIGKTYNTVQALRHFPKNDVWFLGGMSPKNLIHEYGIKLTKDGKNVEDVEKPVKPSKKNFDDEAEYQKALKEYKDAVKFYQECMKGSYTLVDMTKKILVFLEAPDLDTFRMLLPILSHDKEEIEYRFVDKTEKGLRSQRVVIKGFPATIFLTTDRSYLEDLATRSFTATPESSREKITQVNAYINERMSYPWEQLENFDDECVRHIIKVISGAQPLDVVIPFPNLHEIFPKEIVRDMRDFQHFCQFIKPIAALQMLQRPRIELQEGENEGGDKKVKKYIIATAEDVVIALKIYAQIFETTRTCTEDRILRFYHGVVVKRSEWHTRELVEEWNKINEKKVSSDWVKKALQRLSELGYVDYEPDPNDKRAHIYRPLMVEEKGEIRGKFENPQILMEILEKGVQNWLNKIGEKIQTASIEKIFGDGVVVEKLDLGQLAKTILDREKIFSLYTGANFSPILKSSNQAEKQEIDDKIRGEGENHQISPFSGEPTVAGEFRVNQPERGEIKIERLDLEKRFGGKCSWCGEWAEIAAYADGFGVCERCLREHDEKRRGEKRCLNCKYWQGSEVTFNSLCARYETWTSKDYSCGSWVKRED